MSQTERDFEADTPAKIALRAVRPIADSGLTETDRGTPRVITAEDDPEVRALIRFYLQRAGYDVFEAANGTEALDLINSVSPDLVLLDVDMPRPNGFEVLQKIKASTATQHIPVMMLTARDSVDDKVTGLSLGAQDHVSKPFDSKELMARIDAALRIKFMQDELNARNEQLQVFAHTDVLTGLANRRRADDELRMLCANALRYKFPLAVVMLDIDHFKNVNDAYGHKTGDSVLKEFSSRIAYQVREGDMACRWGGEEFLMILPMTTKEGALVFAERVRTFICESRFLKGATEELQLSASLGVAEGNDMAQIVADADLALYAAKEAGRNTVR